MTVSVHMVILLTVSAGTSAEEKLGSHLNDSRQSSTLREELSTPQFGMHMSYISLNEANGPVGGSGTSLRSTTPAPVARPFHGNLPNGAELQVDTQFRNGRPRADGRGRSLLLPRYWPRFTDEELQQISGKYPSVKYCFLYFFGTQAVGSQLFVHAYFP